MIGIISTNFLFSFFSSLSRILLSCNHSHTMVVLQAIWTNFAKWTKTSSKLNKVEQSLDAIIPMALFCLKTIGAYLIIIVKSGTNTQLFDSAKKPHTHLEFICYQCRHLIAINDWIITLFIANDAFDGRIWCAHSAHSGSCEKSRKSLANNAWPNIKRTIIIHTDIHWTRFVWTGTHKEMSLGRQTIRIRALCSIQCDTATIVYHINIEQDVESVQYQINCD